MTQMSGIGVRDDVRDGTADDDVRDRTVRDEQATSTRLDADDSSARDDLRLATTAAGSSTKSPRIPAADR